MSQANENRIVGSGLGSQAHAQSVEEYWTEERRANAIPVPTPNLPKTEHAPHAVPQHGETGSTEPGHQEEHALQPHAAGGHAVVNPLADPYRRCGKVFFTQGGSNYSGSAAMISPNILLTAGHCVYNGGAWSTNFVFYPSYGKRAANDPAYKFTYNYLAAWTGWTKNGNRAYDYGMVWMPSAPGNLISWLGLLWNAPTAGRTWRAVGYPATPNPPFNGNVMDECVGSYVSSGVAGTQGLSNDNMEHGSSGGPWITTWNGSGEIYANGLQSTHIHDGDFTEYGPTFTAETKGLFDWINNPANRH